MAIDCNALRDEMARQTPFYDKMFLKSYQPMETDTLGRHETGAWEMGTGDTHYVDRLDIGQPDLTEPWEAIDSSECGNDPCSPPETSVAMGSKRTHHNMEQKNLKSPLWCLKKLEYDTRPDEQMRIWYEALRKLPTIYLNDWMRVHAVTDAPALEVCDDRFGNIVPDNTPGGNILGQLTTISFGATANLPQSELTFPYLRRIAAAKRAAGYATDSNLPPMMYNLITNDDSWFDLTNGRPEMKSMFAIDDYKKASPLYKVGVGLQEPYGNFAPTITNTPFKFQHIGGGVIQRVFPATNIAGDTGTIRQVNNASLDAIYTISAVWHPKAVKIWTPPGGKLHEMVPSVNSAMFGKWKLINTAQTNFSYVWPDGTECVKNNDEQMYFYWKAHLEQGFQYQQPTLAAMIVHQVDGSGRCKMVNQPVCCTPQYARQYYTNNPTPCVET
jgi:hypothetical protein